MILRHSGNPECPKNGSAESLSQHGPDAAHIRECGRALRRPLRQASQDLRLEQGPAPRSLAMTELATQPRQSRLDRWIGWTGTGLPATPIAA